MNYVAHKMDKLEGKRDKLSIQIQTRFEFEWLTNQLYPSIWCTKVDVRELCVGENSRENFFSQIQMGARKLGGTGNLKQGGLIQIKPT